MKNPSLVLVVLILSSTELTAQQRISVKLDSAQLQNLNVLKKRDYVEITFKNESIDRVLKRYRFRHFEQTYPSARFFNHPASKRVLQYYTFVMDSLDAKLVDELDGLKAFEYVERIMDPLPDYTPNDFALVDPPLFTPDHGSQWYLTNIKAQQAWDITKGNSTVKIGIVDNGFNVTHEDLANQIVFADGDVTGAQDSHGSLVSGIACAETDNGKGLSSIGFNSKLMLYLFDSPFNQMMNASLAGAKVINCSWYQAGCSYSQAQQDIVNMIVTNGTTIVAAAGNGTIAPNCGNPDGYSYPACYDNVISVSGEFYDSYFDSGSNPKRLTFNDKVDLTAPGWHLTTTGGSSSSFYTNQSGTSLAAPLVTGTVALMYSIKGCLTPYEVEFILKKSADQGVFDSQLHPENAPYVNTSGSGRLDARAALVLTQDWPQNLTNYASISGPTAMCSSAGFSLNGVPAGFSIQWSASSNLSITSGQGTPSVLVSRVSDGQGSLQATLTNSCSESVVIYKNNVWVGPPVIIEQKVDGIAYTSSSMAICPGSHELTVVAFGGTPGNATWAVPAGIVYYAGTNKLTFSTNPNFYSISIGVKSSNACGVGPSRSFNLYKRPSGCPPSFTVSAYPNPTPDELTVELVSDQNADTSESEQPFIDEVMVRNREGVVVRKTDDRRHQVFLDVRDLPNGIYYLRVISNGEIFSREILLDK